jgi:ubiquitin carboxyl-terminal hydrolase 7
MNSLLQSLFHLKIFRDLVFSNANDQANSALQKLFYKLKYEKSFVGTTELTKSFGWDGYDSFRQHDVQEFCRVLMDHLEEKLKQTKDKDRIGEIFGGKILNFIECINVNYKSEREEAFYDLQLNVKGCSNIYDSLDQYTQIETLEGDNQYNSDEFGLQNARKGVKLKSLPPVLMFHLKRFEFDIETYQQYKINDKYEFPIELKMGKYFNQELDYVLFSILIHSGNVDSGHYYSFIQKENQWFKFDDEKVYTLSEENVLKDSFGGEVKDCPYFWHSNIKSSKFNFTNAYMLVYIKKEYFKDFSSDENAFPEELSKIIEKENQIKEEKIKEEQEEWKYVPVKVINIQDMRDYQGIGLIDFTEIPNTFKILKQDSFLNLQKMIEDTCEVKVENQKLFTWEKRQNKTFRPSKYLTPSDSSIQFFKFIL